MRYFVLVLLFIAGTASAQTRSQTAIKTIAKDTVAKGGFNDMLRSLKESGRVAVYGIQFVGNTDEVRTAESGAALMEISKLLKSNPILDVFVVGHTDLAGTLEYNRDLSARRAAVVVKLLTEDYGVTITQVTAHGVGPLAPVATNQTEDGRKKNQRIELVER